MNDSLFWLTVIAWVFVGLGFWSMERADRDMRKKQNEIWSDLTNKDQP